MRIAYVLLTDLVLVLLFAGIGRQSHDHGISPLGILQTAAPFLAAVLVGWAFAYLISAVRTHQPDGRHVFNPLTPFPNGTLIWVITVGVGMTARGMLTTDRVTVSFVVVATIFLGLFLVGWRTIAALLARRRTAPSTS